MLARLGCLAADMFIHELSLKLHVNNVGRGSSGPALLVMHSCTPLSNANVEEVRASMLLMRVWKAPGSCLSDGLV